MSHDFEGQITLDTQKKSFLSLKIVCNFNLICPSKSWDICPETSVYIGPLYKLIYAYICSCTTVTHTEERRRQQACFLIAVAIYSYRLLCTSDICDCLDDLVVKASLFK